MRLAAGEKGTSRRLQVSRLRGRGGAGGEGGIIGVGGNDRRLVFMMSIVLGMPGCHTIYGNSSSVVGGTMMDVICPPITTEFEKGLDTGINVEKGLETCESQSQGKGTVSPGHTVRALPPTPLTSVCLSPAGAQQKMHLVLTCTLVPAASPLLCRGAELTQNHSGYECMGARIIVAPHSRPFISSASQPDIANGHIKGAHRHEIVFHICYTCRNSSAPQASR
jgi:hypothetical protein